MKRKSHVQLGIFLADHYLEACPDTYRTAFLFGCTQPDWNPATYLKGSVRHQWLRGHNYPNTSSFIRRISGRLEKKRTLRLWDCYTLGKLIHYTADAFTYAHNADFPRALNRHRIYEAALQEYFLRSFPVHIPRPQEKSAHAFAIFRKLHNDYRKIPGNIGADADFTILASCRMMERILQANHFAKSVSK